MTAETAQSQPQFLSTLIFGNITNMEQDGSFESELASARFAVEELARRGGLSASDLRTLLLGLDALDKQAARARALGTARRRPRAEREQSGFGGDLS